MKRNETRSICGFDSMKSGLMKVEETDLRGAPLGIYYCVFDAIRLQRLSRPMDSNISPEGQCAESRSLTIGACLCSVYRLHQSSRPIIPYRLSSFWAPRQVLQTGRSTRAAARSRIYELGIEDPGYLARPLPHPPEWETVRETSPARSEE